MSCRCTQLIHNCVVFFLLLLFIYHYLFFVSNRGIFETHGRSWQMKIARVCRWAFGLKTITLKSFSTTFNLSISQCSLWLLFRRGDVEYLILPHHIHVIISIRYSLMATFLIVLFSCPFLLTISRLFRATFLSSFSRTLIIILVHSITHTYSFCNRPTYHLQLSTGFFFELRLASHFQVHALLQHDKHRFYFFSVFRARCNSLKLSILRM